MSNPPSPTGITELDREEIEDYAGNKYIQVFLNDFNGYETFNPTIYRRNYYQIIDKERMRPPGTSTVKTISILKKLGNITVIRVLDEEVYVVFERGQIYFMKDRDLLNLYTKIRNTPTIRRSGRGHRMTLKSRKSHRRSRR